AGLDADAGATVTFSDGNPAHNVVATVGSNGTFNVDLSGLSDGPVTASISASDTAGNSATGAGDSSVKDVTADVGGNLSVTINDGDGYINNAERGAVGFTVAGLDADAGATVTFSDGNPAHNVVATVGSNGTFNVDLSGLSDGPVTASISASDTAGNSATGAGDSSVKDVTADVGGNLSVTINDGDGYINNAERGAVGFTVAGLDADAGATVTFSDGNPAHNVVATVGSNGTFNVDLSGLSDGPVTASISASDTAGNSATGAGDSSVKDVTADVGGNLSVTINDGDGYINNAERGAVGFTVAGLDADAGATVTFSDGNPAHNVVATVGSNGTFNVDLSGLSDGPVTASISASDTAGNSATGAGDSSVKDVTADVGGNLSVTINDGDGYINNAERGAVGFTVAGLDADAGATVTFSDGNPAHNVVATVGSNGTFNVDLSGLSDGPVTASISASDTAGNSATGAGDSSVKDVTADVGGNLSVTI